MLTAQGNTAIGLSSANTLSVASTAVFTAGPSFASTVSVAGLLTASGNAVIGSSTTTSSSQSLAVYADSASSGALAVAGLLTAYCLWQYCVGHRHHHRRADSLHWQHMQ